MNCLFLFKSKKPKPRNQRKDRSKAQNSAPQLRNQSQTSSLNLLTPRSLPSPRSIRDLYTEREQNLRVFTYEELSEATYGFNRKLKIGEGGFGNVYKGKIPTTGDSDSSPLIVAIKKLNRQGLQKPKISNLPLNFMGFIIEIEEATNMRSNSNLQVSQAAGSSANSSGNVHGRVVEIPLENL